MGRREVVTKLAWCNGCGAFLTVRGVSRHIADARKRIREYRRKKGTRLTCCSSNGNIIHIPWGNPDPRKKEKGTYTFKRRRFYYRCIACGCIIDVGVNFRRTGEFCVVCPSCGAHLMAYGHWDWIIDSPYKFSRGIRKSVIKDLRREKSEFARNPLS